jgi:hypothetical protein
MGTLTHKRKEAEMISDKAYELAKEYSLTLNEAGCVTNLGKFQGEHWSTLYFWEAFLHGNRGEYELDENYGPSTTIFKVTEEERKLLNLTQSFFAIEETEQGFVYGSEVDQTTVNNWLAEEEKAREAENEAIRGA